MELPNTAYLKEAVPCRHLSLETLAKETYNRIQRDYALPLHDPHILEVPYIQDYLQKIRAPEAIINESTRERM